MRKNIVEVTPGSALTPFRNTTLTLDGDETTVIEAGVRLYRSGSDLAARSAAGVSNASERLNMRWWPTGCWTLQPSQFDIADLFESIVNTGNLMTSADFEWVQVQGAAGTQNMFQDMYNFSQSDIAGASYGAAVPTAGDQFLKKTIPASGTTNPATLNPGFDPGGPSAIPYPNADIPMDRVGFSTTSYRDNQGFFLRWFVPSSANVFMRYLFTFYFGQYAVTVGTVFIYLWEYCLPPAGTVGGYRWVQRTRFPIGSQGSAPGTAHAMGIFPHRHPSGVNYIVFTEVSPDKAPQVNVSQTLTSKTAITGEFVYTIDQTTRQGDVDPAPGYVTMAGKVRLDVRRDMRMQIQMSKLGFDTIGNLSDDDTIAGGGAWTENTNPVNLYMVTSNLGGAYNIVPKVVDGNTQAPYRPGVDMFPEAQFAFSGDGADTPILWAYALKQDPTQVRVSPGPFTIEGQHFNVDCAAGDPQTEAASVIGVIDITGYHSRLKKRERFLANLSTTFTPPNGGSQVNVSLIRGIVVGNRGVQKGVGRTVPANIDPAWTVRNLTLAGMFQKLAEWVEPPFYRVYAVDPEAPPNTLLPWKVTDVLRDILQAGGFADDQIDIPDLPNRFWYGQSQKLEDTTVNPTANLSEYAVRICRDYLGAYLHFEANAGTEGKWILIFGTQMVDGVFNPIYNFQGGPHGHFSPPTNLTAYPANTTFYEGEPEDIPKRADCNMIQVYALVPVTNASGLVAVHQNAVNPISFGVPGMSVPPNPDHPDYLPYVKKLEIIADYLYVPGPDNSGTQAAVDWVCRRLYDFLCHGQLIKKIRAPLVFIHDASIASGASAGWRPLRFQDPVSLDGSPTWLVKSVTIDYSHTRVQMATYELIEPAAGQFFFGFDGKEVIRRLRRLGVIQTSGSSTHSSAHGSIAPSGHREMGKLEAPKVRGGYQKIQNVDGSFKFIDGWNTKTGAAG